MKLPLYACTSNQKEKDGHRKEDDRTEQEIAYDPGDDGQCDQADEVHNGVRQGRPSRNRYGCRARRSSRPRALRCSRASCSERDRTARSYWDTGSSCLIRRHGSQPEKTLAEGRQFDPAPDHHSRINA